MHVYKLSKLESSLLQLRPHRPVRSLGDALCASIVPQSQFGFVKKCGTTDYGSAMSFKVHDELEKRNEILIVSLDVKGAFDRVLTIPLTAMLPLHAVDDSGIRGGHKTT